MGIAEDRPFLEFAWVSPLEQIKIEYARRVTQLSKQPNRKQVRRYRAAVTKLLSLAKKVGPDFMAEIEEAGWSRQNPGADVGDLHMMITAWMAEEGKQPFDMIATLRQHEANIDHWLKTTAEAYKKRDVRKLVVEPFLKLMTKSDEVTTSRKQLPRTRIFEALFDWLGVERKFRPSDAAINAIARELGGSGSASKSNAKRRTKN
jgi:hypothetical protein